MGAACDSGDSSYPNTSYLNTSYLDTLKQYQTFPLHLHWDGSIPATDLFRMAKERGEQLLLPSKDANGKRIEYTSKSQQVIKDTRILEAVMQNLRKYSITDVFSIPIRFMQTKEDLIEAAVAHCHYLKSQNSPYAETRFAPQYHTLKGLQIEQAILHAAEGFQKGRDETGVDVRLIVSIGREAPAEMGVQVAKAAVTANKEVPNMVLGIDLACEENGNPPEKHYDAFKLTFDTPLKRTVHAGEMCPEETSVRNIEIAIKYLQADAIGHAIPLHKYPYLIDEFVKRNIRLESNPLCNEFFFEKDIHADLRLDLLMEKGVLVTINPDDPAMIPGGHLVDNLYRLGKLYGHNFVVKAIENSINSAWGLSNERKAHYLDALVFDDAVLSADRRADSGTDSARDIGGEG